MTRATQKEQYAKRREIYVLMARDALEKQQCVPVKALSVPDRGQNALMWHCVSVPVRPVSERIRSVRIPDRNAARAQNAAELLRSAKDWERVAQEMDRSAKRALHA